MTELTNERPVPEYPTDDSEAALYPTFESLKGSTQYRESGFRAPSTRGAPDGLNTPLMGGDPFGGATSLMGMGGNMMDSGQPGVAEAMIQRDRIRGEMQAMQDRHNSQQMWGMGKGQIGGGQSGNRGGGNPGNIGGGYTSSDA